MSEDEIQVAIHPAAEGGFWAEVEGLPGCITQAENNTQALERLRDVHAAWIAAAPGAPGAGAPPGEVPATAGEAARWLAESGWARERESGHHLVFAGGDPPARIALPRPEGELLKEGFRAALKRAIG